MEEHLHPLQIEHQVEEEELRQVRARLSGPWDRYLGERKTLLGDVATGIDGQAKPGVFTEAEWAERKRLRKEEKRKPKDEEDQERRLQKKKELEKRQAAQKKQMAAQAKANKQAATKRQKAFQSAQRKASKSKGGVSPRRTSGKGPLSAVFSVKGVAVLSGLGYLCARPRARPPALVLPRP